MNCRKLLDGLLAWVLCNTALAAAPETCGVATDNLLPSDMPLVFEFSQSKTISTISRPLRSSGLLGLSAAGELVWQTREPLLSTLVINTGSLKLFNREDVLVNELSNESVQQMSAILLQVLGRDTAALENSFAINATCSDDGGWQLNLQPLAQLGELLNSVSFAGHQNIETIRFSEKRGDVTELALTQVPATRLAELERYLGH